MRIYKNSVLHTKKVHRLVAIAFIENPEKKSQVNHIDENKKNNILNGVTISIIAIMELEQKEQRNQI